jgi:hypothetical protein
MMMMMVTILIMMIMMTDGDKAREKDTIEKDV